MAGILLTTIYRFLNPDISFACHGFIPSFVNPHILFFAVFHCFQTDFRMFAVLPLKYASISQPVKITVWNILLHAFVSSFCSSGYDFAIASSLPHLTVRNLQVAFEFVGNYASVDFHHRALICPSYCKSGATEYRSHRLKIN